jgi:fumarate reductase flavoprotein subunit
MVVDVEKGTVSDVSIKAPYETPSRGGVAREKIEETMNASGSIDVDTVSGATVTSVAILDAAAHAYGEALGTLPQSSEMAPGTYRASSYGFYPGLPVEVEVTVGADAIESVQIVGENLETEPMLRAVEETYIPRIIEGQSLSVDVVTGATMTSSAVRLAAEQCVKDAYAAADVAPEAVFSWLKAADYGTPDPVALDADVVVIGLGGSGLAAALSAVENGLDVIAIDKAGKYGGTTCVTSESFAMNPAGMEADRNGGQDFVDAEELKADWRERAHGDAKDAMLDLFFAESGATIDWLNDEHDWPYNLPNPGHADYATYDCCFTYDPYTLSGRKTELSARIDGLVRQYTDLGGRMLLEVEAQELLADEATNAVVGVRAVGYDGTEYTVNARAVVLATGGFGENTPLMNTYMVDDYFPLAGTWHLYGMATNTGLMIAEALRLGAATYNPSVPPISHLAGFPVNLFGFGTNRKDEESFFTGYTAIWSEGDIPQTLCVAADSLAVTRSGKRFINEEEFASHGAIKAGPEYYTIWSQAQLDTFKTQGLSYEDPGPSMGYLGCQSTIPLGVPLTQIDAVMEAAVATGYVQRADTVAELAGLIEIDPAVLEATVDAYNEACAAGIDEEFGKNPDYLVPVAEGPYYAVLGCAFYYTTSGGLDVDENLQVLREDGTTIEGLYAVGTDSMGVLMTNQEQYLDYGGAASGWAFTSGRLVGKALAEKLG